MNMDNVETNTIDLKEDITMSNDIDTSKALTTIDILDFGDVHCYMDNSTKRVMLLSDDVARELGFIHNENKTSPRCWRNSYTTIRWSTINKYLSQYGLPSVSSGTYMDQDAVIYLAIKASNQKAKVLHRRLVEVIIPYFISNVSKSEYQQMQEQIKNQQEYINTQDKFIESVQPATHQYHESTNDDAYITIQQIADNYGMSAQELNTLLYKLDLHHPINNGWVLNKRYKDEGLVCTRKRKTSDGEYEFTVGYTEKGRVIIDQILHDNGYKTKQERERDIDDRIQMYNDRIRQQIPKQPQIVNNYITNNNYYYNTPQPQIQYGDPNNCPIMFVSEEYRKKYKTVEEFREHREECSSNIQ